MFSDGHPHLMDFEVHSVSVGDGKSEVLSTHLPPLYPELIFCSQCTLFRTTGQKVRFTTCRFEVYRPVRPRRVAAPWGVHLGSSLLVVLLPGEGDSVAAIGYYWKPSQL